MVQEDIQAGVVGCGPIPDSHIMGYKSFGGAQVVAVCDIGEAKARAKAEEHPGLKWYTHYRKLFESGQINTVSVCSTNPSHPEIAISAVS